MSKVFVTHKLPGERLHSLAEACDLQVWPGPGLLPASELPRRLAGCVGAICLLTDRFDGALLRALPALRFLSSVSVGLDHIDLQAATERALPVGHTPGVLVDATADTTMALLLAAARRIAEGDRFIRAGGWCADNAWSPDFFVGRDLAGATLGIIGLGAIGQAVARRAAAFGMQIVAWNRSPRDVAGVTQVSLEELLACSDFVSVNVALTEATRDLLNARRIAAMKRGCVLVNTARGGIVDEDALAAALRDGQLFAAGIDVFAREPLPADSPLLKLPNVVLAPHVGSATAATRAAMADLAVDNALAALAGKRMAHCANPEVYGA